MYPFTLFRYLCALTMVLNATRILLLLALLPVKGCMLTLVVGENDFKDLAVQCTVYMARTNYFITGVF